MFWKKGWYYKLFPLDHRALFWPSKYPRSIWSVRVRGIRVSIVSSMHTYVTAWPVSWLRLIDGSPAASLIPYGNLFPGAPEPECMLIVDSGFSFTHVVPILNRRIFWSAVKRFAYLLHTLPQNLLKLPQAWRRWEAVDKSAQRTHFIPPMEYDGRDTYYEPCEGVLLFRFSGFQQGSRDLPVRILIKFSLSIITSVGLMLNLMGSFENTSCLIWREISMVAFENITRCPQITIKFL